MTIQQAIELVDKLKPNQYEHEQKVKWLSKIDGQVWIEVISTHWGCYYLEPFSGYDASNPDTELLVPYPFAEDIYNYFLQSQIDKENGETGKYSQNAAAFNAAYKTFCDWYNRTHRPFPSCTQFRV